MELNNYIDLLRKFVSFKSISTDPSYVNEINKTASWLKELFDSNGFQTYVIEGYDNPIVVAKYIVGNSFDTALIYGHYDVQPADKSEGWLNDPFELFEKDKKLYARGVADNKGQILVHIFSLFELIKSSKLNYNVIFLIEGSEESGSTSLDKFIEDHKDLLKCDFIFFSDGELNMEHPVIETGFRGIVNVTIKITTATKDNHSGLYGGSVPNAALILAKLISSMYDENMILSLGGRLNNSWEGVSIDLLKDAQELPFDEGAFLVNTGAISRLNNTLSDSSNFYMQVFSTVAEVTSLQAGYQGVGYRNAIPGSALAKINFRISPRHTVSEILDAFKSFLEENVPKKYARYELEVSESAEPILIDVNNVYARKIKDLASSIYERKCFLKFCGAIVPVAGLFQRILGRPVVSLGLCNEDCNMHGVNENFDVDLIQKSIQLSVSFFSNK